MSSILHPSIPTGGEPFRMPNRAGNPDSNLAASANRLAGRRPLSATAEVAGNAAAGSASGTAASPGSSASISANDFLTLLVTEMQNQDPTSQSDPNQYVNQLVQINSLEQLVSINQNLAAVLGAASTPGKTPSQPGNPGPGSAPGSGVGAPGANLAGPRRPAPFGGAAGSSPQASASGLRSEKMAASAHSVARALDGHPRGAGRSRAASPAQREIPTHRL